MLISGEWLPFNDGIVRPILRAELLDGDSVWRGVEFLVDTGADRTVISGNVLKTLRLPFIQPEDRIGGVGGVVASVDVNTQIRLARDGGQSITVRGTYAACLQQEVLDISVLGRDVLNFFSVIVDRPADRLILLHGSDSYSIQRRA